jgi:competence protein ComEC
MRKLLPIIMLVTALALGTWYGYRPKPLPNLGPSLRVDFIDVGQGDSIFIHTPDGKNALIDAGEEEYGPRVVEHLQRAGVKRLDLVVISHPHSDHVGGIPDVLEAFPVKLVLDSGYAHGTQSQERALRIIERKKIPFRLAKPGMNLLLGSRARLEVLGPPQPLMRGTSSDANNNSVVIRLVFDRVSMLFTGDIQSEAEAQLIASHRNLVSQVLKVAHHGSSSSTSLELLRLVRPDYLIISVGEHNDYGHPSRKTLRRLSIQRTAAQLYRTDRNGTVTVRTDGRRIVVEAER